jgi:hypothetical protein
MKQWTVMAYMAADNNLYRQAQRNLRQIGKTRSEALNIVIQVDGQGPEDIRRYVVNNGTVSSVHANPDCSDRQHRLEDFLNWGTTEYSAERYFLLLWGHGDGLDQLYVYGNPAVDAEITFAATERQLRVREKYQRLPTLVPYFEGVLHGRDANHYLQDAQLGTALQKFVERTGRKIDLLGYDACAMGLLEVCTEVADSISVSVASAGEIPTHGWPYERILSDLTRNPAVDARTLGALITNRYVDAYSTKENRKAVTLASVDLAKNDTVIAAMATLAERLTGSCNNDRDLSCIWQARNTAQCYSDFAYLDVCDFCRQLRARFPAGHSIADAADNVMDSLLKNGFLIYQQHSNTRTLARSSGMAIYFPVEMPLQKPSRRKERGGQRANNKNKIIDYDVIWDHYERLEFCKKTNWATFLQTILNSRKS